MKIASITVYCDEEFRLNKWLKYYEEYKEEVYMHIIVNNGKKYETEILKKLFPESNVLYISNKSLSAAYNAGLNVALENKDVDAIMKIGNDVKIKKGGTTKLYNFLHSNKQYGMVAPVLLKKDSEEVEVYGQKIRYCDLALIPQYKNIKLSDIKISSQICDSVPGGMNIAGIKFYKKIGLHDELLYMYSEEVEVGIRAKEKNIIIAATKEAVAWHQHENFPGMKSRKPLNGYLVGRNEILLAWKYYNCRIVIRTFLTRFMRGVRRNVAAILKNHSIEQKVFCKYYMLGVLNGLLNKNVIPKKILY